MLMQFKRMYELIKSFFKNNIISIILSMLIGIMIWEVQNIFSKDWIYLIPFIKLELFSINIVVVIGWVVLIWRSIMIFKFIEKTK